MYYLNLFLKKYGWAPNLVVITLLAGLVSQRVNLEVRRYLSVPVREGGSETTRGEARNLGLGKRMDKARYAAILDRNLFNSAANEEVTEDIEETTTIDDELDESPLSSKVELRTTLVSPAASLASIWIKAESKLAVVRPGDPLIEGATVEAIEPRRVVIKRAGKLEEIKLKVKESKAESTMWEPTPVPDDEEKTPGSAKRDAGKDNSGIEEAGTNHYIIEERLLQDKLSQLNQIITQARLVPNFSAGQIDGFKIFAIKPRSVYQQLGLQNGDILESVNGVILDNPTKGLQVFQDLKNQKHFTINLKRRGQRMTLEYEVR